MCVQTKQNAAIGLAGQGLEIDPKMINLRICKTFLYEYVTFYFARPQFDYTEKK